MRRLILLTITALALAPGTWVRTEDTARDYRAPITVTPIETREGLSGPLMLEGAWALNSRNPHFGGYSALVVLSNGNLLIGSDRGRRMELKLTNAEPVADGAKLDFLHGRGPNSRNYSDLEAYTRDPATGTIWAAYEHGNVIERIAPGGAVEQAKPPEMQSWSSNSGPETLVRLKDGRFLILGEAPEQRGLGNRPGLLFAGDPVAGVEPIQFRYKTTPGFSPVDAALLPDGDVLILERRVKFTLPAATFDARLLRADPTEITEDGVWSGGVLQTLRGRIYGENFEGVEFVPDPDDPEAGSVYLIADDNLSIFQRSLLVRFAWPPVEPDGDEDRPDPSTGESAAEDPETEADK